MAKQLKSKKSFESRVPQEPKEVKEKKYNKNTSFKEWMKDQDLTWLKTVNWHPRIIIARYCHSLGINNDKSQKEVEAMELIINDYK